MPELGRSVPASMRSSVVFPAPFGPMMARRSPCATSIETWSRSRCRTGSGSSGFARKGRCFSSGKTADLGDTGQRPAAQARRAGALVVPAVRPAATGPSACQQSLGIRRRIAIAEQQGCRRGRGKRQGAGSRAARRAGHGFHAKATGRDTGAAARRKRGRGIAILTAIADDDRTGRNASVISSFGGRESGRMSGHRAAMREGVSTLPGTPRPVATSVDGRSPGSRVDGLASLPGRKTSGVDGKASPLTVAGAATASSPGRVVSPCSLLIPWAWPREPSTADRRQSECLSSNHRPPPAGPGPGRDPADHATAPMRRASSEPERQPDQVRPGTRHGG